MGNCNRIQQQCQKVGEDLRILCHKRLHAERNRLLNDFFLGIQQQRDHFEELIRGRYHVEYLRPDRVDDLVDRSEVDHADMKLIRRGLEELRGMVAHGELRVIEITLLVEVREEDG